MSGGGSEASTKTIKAMVGASCSGYPRDKSGACGRGGGRGRRVQRNRREMESRIGKGGGRETEMTRINRDDQM